MPTNRSSTGILFEPASHLTHSAEFREKWLADAAAGYVSKGKANHRYYSLVLKLLWPEGHGLPGPHVKEEVVRKCIDDARLDEGKKPYRDPFRRLRELQGDEGFKSIIKSGISYQLQSPIVSAKRPPRSKPSAKFWRELQARFGGACGKCGRKGPDIKLSPDHRTPRSRGGTGDEPNWQPLCKSCNILKSAACQGCTRLCSVCHWAYPEVYSQLEIDDEYRAQIRQESERKAIAQELVLRSILEKHFRTY
jgi:HNH endonuclease